MKTKYKLALALLVGVSVGLVAAETIQAQQMKPPPAYVIAEVAPDPTKPADPAASQRYATETPKLIASFGGRYVVRGGKVQTLEGEEAKGLVEPTRG